MEYLLAVDSSHSMTGEKYQPRSRDRRRR